MFHLLICVVLLVCFVWGTLHSVFMLFWRFPDTAAVSLLLKRVGRRFSVYKVSFPFSVFSFPFVLIHPLRFARPPVSGGKEGLQKKHWMCFCAL